MKTELKIQESEEMQEFLALKIQKELEAILIDELLKKLQAEELEKTVLEEETQKRVTEDEESKLEFLEYGIEVETAYSKDKGAYHIEQPYEQDHSNQTGYENKNKQ